MRTMQKWTGFAVVLVAHTLLVAHVCAEPADTTSVPGSHLVITEVGMATTIGNSRVTGDDLALDFAFGYLRRTGRPTMVGGEFAFTGDGQGTYFAFRPRLRQNLGRSWGVDLAAGPILAASVNSGDLDGPGVSATVGLDYRGYMGVRLEVQSVPYRVYGPYDATPHRARLDTTRLGVRLGRTPGVIATLGLVVLAGVAVANWDNGY